MVHIALGIVLYSVSIACVELIGGDADTIYYEHALGYFWDNKR